MNRDWNQGGGGAPHCASGKSFTKKTLSTFPKYLCMVALIVKCIQKKNLDEHYPAAVLFVQTCVKAAE